ncbi:hypothetical protein [Paracoccus shandongensis]|uniref:hypothetical protein n=1 Tax=Paracoccus shandongensis TaxID=2816048 RepID=UPI001A8FDD7B|nr:hypothetical protein [Paracoccus shandongensis]
MMDPAGGDPIDFMSMAGQGLDILHAVQLARQPCRLQADSVLGFGKDNRFTSRPGRILIQGKAFADAMQQRNKRHGKPAMIVIIPGNIQEEKPM